MSVLNMVRLVLNTRPVVRLLPRRYADVAVDEGALLHAGLANLFATSSEHATVPMQPFAIDDRTTEEHRDPEHIFLLGYSAFDEAELQARMGPRRSELVAEVATRGMHSFPAGTRLDFRTRVCPTIRSKRSHPSEVQRQKAYELDVWLAERFAEWEPQKPALWDSTRPFDVVSDRERSYGEWLRRELLGVTVTGEARPHRMPAADLEGPVHLVEFRQDPFHRSPTKHARDGGKGPKRPNAVLEGTLRVTDADAFTSLLARGIGRHRAYGFGMLLVRRAV